MKKSEKHVMSTQTTLRPPEFSGKEADFPYYMLKLEAYASERNLAGAMLEAFGTELPSMQTTVLDPTTNAMQIAAKEMNAKLMNALILGMKENKMINVISLSKTADWPSGKAWKVIAALKK